MNIQVLLNTIKNLVDNETEVTSQMVQKGTETLTGITIGKGNIRPTVYMEHYEELFETDGYEVVAKEMIKLCKKAGIPNVNCNEITTWEYAKNNLLLCIEPKGTNKNYVTIPYLDLDLYFRVKVSDDGTYRVNEMMLSSWCAIEEDLLDIVMQTNKFKANSMKETMIKIMIEDGMPEEYIEEIRNNDAPDQTVVTNEENLYGAAAIYNKAILKQVADKYESDLYILPSSIHEILLLPTTYGYKNEMDAMVKEVNETQVEPNEVLANHSYIFRRNTMEIEC